MRNMRLGIGIGAVLLLGLMGCPSDPSSGTDLGTGDAVMTGAPTTLAATLSGGQEVPQNFAPGRGTAVITVDGAKSKIDVQLDVQNITGVTAGHIHFSKPGISGGVLFPLNIGSLPAQLKQTLTAADFTAGAVATFSDAVNAVLAGQTYVNLHTAANPGGEIRGHIGPAILNVGLSAGQEVQLPAVASAATGTASVKINGTQDQIDVTLNTTGLANVTMAHIHGATSGRNGSVLFTLATQDFGGNLTKTLKSADLMPNATITNLADAVNALLSGQTYVNVHTTTNAGGEIRGQVGPATLRASLAGSQETPAIVSPATGTAVLTLDGEQSQIGVTVSHTGFVNTITLAHLHVGAATVAGGVVFPLAPASFTSPFTATLKSADLMMPAGITSFADAVNALFSGKLYVNLHTNVNAGGELRGQIGPQRLKATLNGTSEMPAVVTTATGTANVFIDGGQSTLDVTVTHTGFVNTVTMAHIHVGAVGSNGAVIFGLAAAAFNSPLNVTRTTADLMTGGVITNMATAINALVSGQTYVNIHTNVNATGEIRGQLSP